MLRPTGHPLLEEIGNKVRKHRLSSGWTLKQAAERSGLSPRFLTQLESGNANIAIGRLAALADGFGLPLADLFHASTAPSKTAGAASIESDEDYEIRSTLRERVASCPSAQLRPCLSAVEAVMQADSNSGIALLGMRGAGKSTLGSRLAPLFNLPFVELDHKIEEIAGLSVSEIFALHGEPYYRRLAFKALAQIVAQGQKSVIALPGGIVKDEDSFSLALNCFTTIWLKAKPQDYVSRVIAQGDHRPVSGRRDATAELKGLLRLREPLYSKANIEIQTSNRSVAATVQGLLAELEKENWH